MQGSLFECKQSKMLLSACILLLAIAISLRSSDVCRQSSNSLLSISEDDVSVSEKKYLIYDINHGEGFNLRRDVFMRVANTVRMLRENGYNYLLVLPPWGGLYHWSDGYSQIPWSRFFDVQSINEFVPVIEFHSFLEKTNRDLIDEVIYMQGYAEGWTSGNFEFKYDKRECIDGNKYYKYDNGRWKGWFFGFEKVFARKFSCVSIQGDSVLLATLIKKNYSQVNSLMIERAETILHTNFGDVHYWRARRSMRYAVNLIHIGDEFRKKYLNSDDSNDQTMLQESWKDTRKTHGDAQGGKFICVHWRRRDFVRSHASEIPSINGTAHQVIKALKVFNFSRLFLSTDASVNEVAQLKKLLSSEVRVTQFLNSSMSDGEVSVVDQWICAHAKHFIGTHASTFSYRIQEDREILGFKPETTFNRLCPDHEENCEQPAKWKIVY